MGKKSVVVAMVVMGVVACGGAMPASAPPAAASGAGPDPATSAPEPKESQPAPETSSASTIATEGGPPMDAAAVPPGKGFSCFVTIGMLCERTEAACNQRRDTMIANQKAQGATKEDLDTMGACTGKTSVWCHTLKLDSGGYILWCGDGDEEGKGQCMSHVEQLTAGGGNDFSGCAKLE